MFAMYNPTAFGVGFVSFDVKFGEEARKFVKIRIPLCASETVVSIGNILLHMIQKQRSHYPYSYKHKTSIHSS